MCSSTAPEPNSEHSAASASHLTDAQRATQYQAWYPLFRSHALRSHMVALPPAFIEYLLSDGVFLGDATQALFKAASDSSSDSEDENLATAQDADSQASSADALQDWTELFPDLRSEIEAAIENLGGKVVPKLNWSSPTDAVWVNPCSTIACENAEQVVLLLKSSDRVVHDLELLSSHTAHVPPTPAHLTQPVSTSSQPAAAQPAPQHEQAPQPAPVAPTLILRKWHDLRPEREWRCFVRSGQLVGVSQRDPTQHFPQLCTSTVIEEDQPASLESLGHTGDVHPLEVAAGPVAREACRLLQQFHSQHVRDTFTLQHYTYDAYVATNHVVKLIDFNPVGGTTSPLLFTWEQLGLADAASRPSLATHELDESGVPEDVQAPVGTPDYASTDPGQVPGSAVQQGAAGQSVRVRVVPAAGSVQPGYRAACAMPFDMLGLQDGVDGMIGRMQMS